MLSWSERRDLLLPDLKRLRQTGGESRRRAEGKRHRCVGDDRQQLAVRRPARRRARLLESRGAPISGTRRSALAAAVLTPALLAAGCGGGRLSHGAYVKHADAICSAYRADTPPLAKPRSYDSILSWGAKTLPLYAGALRQLSALQAPQADFAQVQTWLAADRKVQRAVRDLVAAAQKRDFASVSSAASRAQLAGSESRRAAQALGLQVCGTVATSR
jgi:hypothetical protein